MDSFCQFAMVAADEAIADSGFDEANIDPKTFGGIEEIYKLPFTAHSFKSFSTLSLVLSFSVIKRMRSF